MDNKKTTHEKKHNLTLLSEMWLYGVVTASLVAISNLLLFLVLKVNQILPVSAGAVVCAGVFLASRLSQQKKQIYLSAIIGASAWVGLIIIHEIFWAGIFGFLLVGTWLLPVIWLSGLPAGIRRISTIIPCLVATIAIVLLERYPLFGRIAIGEFSISRYITPIYFFILGVLLFLVFLRGIYTRLLSARMIISMATIVFIPIGILTMVAYSNTKMNDTLAAVNALDQTASRKSDEVLKWTSDLSISLENLLTETDTNQLILRLLQAHASDDSRAELAYRNSLEFVLANLGARYGFEEIYIIDPLGIVVTSTRDDLIDADFRYYEFFWEGKVNSIILPPRYFQPEDQVSIFISHPIRNTTNEIAGVLSARASIDRMINIVTAPAIESYKTTLSYLVNTDGTLLITSSGRSSTNFSTLGAQTVLSTQQNGTASYTDIDSKPVIGAYHWIPDLKVAILVEASEAEIFQRLPGIITGNLSIGILAFLLAIIAAITIVRSITNPIGVLVSASQDVIAGNLNIQVETDREDELGTLTDSFNKMTSEIKVLVSSLETRVADRTHDLELRALELQTAALIARDASLASNVNDLLNRTARLIRERFGFYHVGIFLNDDKNDYAVLSAAAGDAGQVLLANNHKLKVGETGIVGTVSKTGEPRIALDVGADAEYFRNPMLPYTRSEMTLPLKVGTNIIGVLDVQSDKVNAYDQNDITIMSILTDQLAIAIERTRLLEESNRNTAIMEMALQSQTSRAWREYLNRSRQARGYRYEGVEVKTLDLPDFNGIEGIGLAKPKIDLDEDGKSGCTATIPVRLRGLTIATLKLKFSTDQIPSDTMRFLEEASDRLSLALENARLFQDAQRLASQEQQINLISGQIQQSTDFETILQNAISELGKTLGVPKTFIQIGLAPLQDK